MSTIIASIVPADGQVISRQSDDQFRVPYTWWRHQMETFSSFTGHSCGEFTGHRWIALTNACDAEL